MIDLVREMDELGATVERFAKARKTADEQEEEMWQRQEQEREALFNIE